MSDLFLHPDQIIKQEQSKDLLCEVEHYRLIKAVAQPRPTFHQAGVVAPGKLIPGLFRYLSNLMPVNGARA
ncbi:MAG: hypothetical protein JSV81_16825 [Anaerolineales bacterium]|nr:MAG: hypothetical protein JSV81_16825 [Anaerolineales bacterium]